MMAMTPKKDVCVFHQCQMLKEGKECPMLMVGKEGDAIDCPVCKKHLWEEKNKGGDKKILYWTDTMMPGFKSDKPGKSPMGMEMVPVYKEENGPLTDDKNLPNGYAAIALTAQKQQLIGVKTALVKKERLVKTIRTVGTVSHDPELYQTEAEYIEALKNLEQAQKSNTSEIFDQAKKLVESSRIRLKHMGLSDALVEEIASYPEAEHSLLYAHPGQPVWVYAQVYEYELPLVLVGQEVNIEIPA